METRFHEKPRHDVRCQVTSLSAFVQQLAVQLVPRGYWYYVTGIIPEGSDPEHVDQTIIKRYDIRNDPSGRRSAELKRRGIANVKYLRHGRFYVIIATKGEHFFKLRERDRVRCLRKDRRAASHSNMGRVQHIDLAFPYAPLLVPVDPRPRSKQHKKKKKQKPQARPVFEGYAISSRRGRYLKKTSEEKAEYRRQLADWKRQTELGKRLPRPARGKKDDKWRTHTEIEARSLVRLESYLLGQAVRLSAPALAMEFHSTPYQPYWAIKNQLLGILKKVNRARSAQGLSELPYKTVLGMKRPQVRVFVEGEGDESQAA